MKSFFSTFQENIKRDHTLLLAVSGGVDSMVLLDLIQERHPKDKIVVVHFDHSLRGAESDGDREFVANQCDRYGIQFESKKLDIAGMAKEEKMNIEAIARRERYKYFEEMKARFGAKYIITAHHAVDQTETIIANMLKGAKVRGFSGMRMLSGDLFRPLLSTTKKGICDYATKNKIEYREDSTNNDIRFDRNRIRRDIIPVLESLNPSVHATISDLVEYMQELRAFLLSQVELWLKQGEKETKIPGAFHTASFTKQSPFFQSEIISYLYAHAQGGSSQGLSRGLVDELIRFISDPGSFGKKEIKNLKLERRGDKIILLSDIEK